MVTNQNDQDLGLFLVKFPASLLARIDSFSLKMRTASREETFLVMACTFAKKHGIEIPSQPIPQSISPTVARRYQARHDLRHSIALRVSKDRENGWVALLMKKSGEVSPKTLFRRIVSEFDETTLA